MVKNNKNDKLGRRIFDLIEENEVKMSENEEIIDVSVDQIYPNPEQPRTYFEKHSLNELADSIKKHGVIQPIILRPKSDGYLVVAGERRLRASKIAGNEKIPAIIRDYNTIFLAELAILENLQREDLSPIEEAIAYQRILKNTKISHSELAYKIGKSRSYVTNIVGLIKLPNDVIEMVNEKEISMAHAKILSKLHDEDKVKILAKKIKEDKVNVRDLEQIIRKVKKGLSFKNAVNVDEEQSKFIEKQLKSDLNLKVKTSIQNNSVTIKFSNESEIKHFIDYITKRN